MYYNSEFTASYNESEKNHSDGKVYYIKQNGKEEYDKELSPKRFWPQGNKGRVCYIEIPLCNENKNNF